MGAMQALGPDDNIVATYREHGQALARGIPAGALMAEMYGKANGCSRGRGGSMHFFDVSRRFYGGHAIVGGGLPIAVGLGARRQAAGRGTALTACFFGDGAVGRGRVPRVAEPGGALEAARALPVREQPLCHGHRALAPPVPDRYPPEGRGLRDARRRRWTGWTCSRSRRRRGSAAASVRGGDGPFLLELRTYRFRAHSMADPELYRAKQEVEEWKTRDPIALFVARLREAGLLAEADLAAIEAARGRRGGRGGRVRRGRALGAGGGPDDTCTRR